MQKKKREFPHAFVILFAILALMAVLTWIVPAGQYGYVEVNGKNVVDPASFQYVEQSPVGVMEVFEAIPQGIQGGIALIAMILTIGACIGLVNGTGALTAAVMAFSRKVGAKNSKLVLIGVMVFFLFIGAFPSMLEGSIPFAAVIVPICLSLGYDVITGIAVVFVADIIGWAAGPANYYTVGNAQTIGGLELFSGFGYRMVSLVVLGLIGIVYVVRYAEKVRQDPSHSIMAGTDYSDLMNAQEEVEFDGRKKLICVVFLVTVALIVIGCLKWGWGLTEMSGVYLLSGMICGVIAGYNSGKIADELLVGAQSVFVAAMAIGVARGIGIVMANGMIQDTIVHALAQILNGLPVAEITGFSKQLTILAFQFGDGLSNLCYPTMGALIAFLMFGRVPFNKWFKFIMPFMLISWAACIALLVIGAAIGY